jgi:C-terminal processing protease CtpA/Prc
MIFRWLAPRKAVFLLLIAATGLSPGRALGEELSPAAVERLARLGRIWGEVRWGHPWVLTRGLDVETPLLAAIPKVAAARDDEAERAALTEFLAALGDPATHLATAVRPLPPARTWTRRWVEPGLLEIELGVIPDWNQVTVIKGEIAKASGVIFDLRGQPDDEYSATSSWVSALADALPARDFTKPGVRSVVHHGYRDQQSAESDYFSAVQEAAPEVLGAAPGEPARRVALLIDSTTPITGLIVGLQQAGLAVIVAQGDAWRVAGCERRVELGAGQALTLRTCELAAEWRPDVQLPAGAPRPRDEAWASAVRWLRAPPERVVAAAAGVFASKQWRRDPLHSGGHPPSFPLRVLAAYRLWNTIRYFFPYKHLLDSPWEPRLAEHLPDFARADSEEAYEEAVQRFGARVQDTHVQVAGPALDAREARNVDARLMTVEGQSAIVEAGPAASAAGLRVGDVVEAVDGERLAARLERLRPLTASSTPQALTLRLLRRALAGPKGSTAELVVRGADGGARTIRVERGEPRPPPAVLPWRLLADGTGYVDLRILDGSQIDSMLETLGKAPSIVFDLRGYPRGIFWLLAPRLNLRGALVAATGKIPLVDAEGPAPDGVPPASHFVQQLIAPTAKPPYAGRTVMLLDERAVSLSEHTALFLRAAAGTTFVGSATAGANGNVTTLVLPGDVSVSFTGLSVEWPDGRQLQRVGILPDVPARPTLLGLRQGRDEVLESALAYLRRVGQGVTSPAR